MLTPNQQQLKSLARKELHNILIRGMESIITEHIGYNTDVPCDSFTFQSMDSGAALIFEDRITLELPAQGLVKCSHAFLTGGNDVVVICNAPDEDEDEESELFNGEEHLFRIDLTASDTNFINEHL